MVEVSTHPPEFDASGRGTCSRRSSFVAAVSVSARTAVSEIGSTYRRLSAVKVRVCRGRVADAPSASRAPIGPRRVALARQLIDTLVGGIALWPFAPLGR